ncbi:unnamed protein product [Didymodactylos carnosus]|uniref:Uncharacterized protein n=1 Tax=Didymodactylos carnosus TaxID=1234261 RepID=A0A815R8H3_9BILA|nr:unnamed protein product [Didymodactylos carnosus]CAF1518964.1 unnamed protein product [Didymodactylos carnosus]CAF4306005.1 unnamed protein product [Didymodactylos carnosus]CAF4340185.1 unnamed protein product [Didymodactylos carnosus]
MDTHYSIRFYEELMNDIETMGRTEEVKDEISKRLCQVKQRKNIEMGQRRDKGIGIYPCIRIEMQYDSYERFTSLAFIHVPEKDLNNILQSHFVRPFSLIEHKDHHLKMKRIVSSTDKLTRLSISTHIRIVFAPMCNGVSTNIIKSWFEYFGTIRNVSSYFDESLMRTVANINYEKFDSVNKIITSSPLDPLLMESVSKIVNGMDENNPAMQKQRERVNDMIRKQIHYHLTK